MTDVQEPTWYDANDPVQLKAFDDRLWPMLKAAREYHEQDAGLAEASLGMFGVTHQPIWDLVNARPDPDRVQVWLRIVPKGQGADVEVRLVDPDGAEQLHRIPGLKLISPAT